MERRNHTTRARNLRKEATDTESHLWVQLRARCLLGFKFK